MCRKQRKGDEGFHDGTIPQRPWVSLMQWAGSPGNNTPPELDISPSISAHRHAMHLSASQSIRF
jgi:hypothetical protein